MITLKTFTGETPRTLPHLLGDNAAQNAVDCDFAAGALMGLRKNSSIAGITAAVKSMYVHDTGDKRLYTWEHDVIALRGTIANDAFSRFYWLDGGILYVSRADAGSGEPGVDNRFKVGVPFPQTPPELDSIVATTATYIEHRVYVFTYVNEFGEEGAPSATLEVDLAEGSTVNLILAGSDNAAGYCPITKMRIYRSATGATTTDLYFLTEIDNAPGGVLFSDSTPAELLSSPLSTKSFYPPEAWLENIVALPNGIFALSKGNEIYFCQSYLPYAYRPEDVITTATPVVGMCAAEGGMYVTTTTNPYFVSGMTPDAMSETKITAIQAGVSRRSICNIGQSVIYASHDGLVSARGVAVDMNYSLQLFTREEWRDRYASKLSKMRLDAHDGNLVAWFEDGTPGFLIRFDGEDLAFTKLTDIITASFVYPLGDALYLSTPSGVVEFKGATSRKACVWHSKDFVLPKPASFGACVLRGKGSVSIAVYAEGALIHTEQAVLNTPAYVFRLPPVDLSYTWSVKISCAAEAMVTEFGLAGSPSDFANV